jgi:hypothetical protein
MGRRCSVDPVRSGARARGPLRETPSLMAATPELSATLPCRRTSRRSSSYTDQAPASGALSS